VPLTDSRKSSPPSRTARSRGALLIAAVSGRALAGAAVEAGYVPLVADFFADADTQDLAHACRKMPGAIARGFQWRSLGPALEALARQAPAPLAGVVYGSGFEDRPLLLDRMAERWPLLGNDAAVVETTKSPERFFATLDRLAIPHPVTVMERPGQGAGWVAKRRGGAGGGHVVPARLQLNETDVYYQALIEGRAVSALFLATKRKACVLGFSEQWTTPAPRRLWRYGGAVRPAALPHAAMAGMMDAVTRAASAFGLQGLASADFVLEGNHPFLLEINPRPGATLDIFAGAAKSLLRLHVDAVTLGRLPRESLVFEGAAASGLLYAPEPVVVPRNMIWPAWAADRPRPGERIDKYRPICTVLARAGTRGRAKRLVENRTASLLAKIKELTKGDYRDQKERRERHRTAEHQRAGRTAGPHPHR
jgi:predicted ATP-grasp superfamily ATP-dependent carboligase